MKTGTVVGQPMDRVDGRAKVTGGARYAAEFSPKNVAHGVLVSSWIAKGRIREIDARDAEKASGVLAVITHLNAPKVSGKSSGGDRNLLLLQDDAVQYDRQYIAVVVAETLEQATYAAELVRVVYDSDKPDYGLQEKPEDSYKPDTQLPRRESLDTSRGDFDAAFASAPVKIEQVYRTPVENHNPMEPHATTAVWDGDQLTIYDSTQGVFGDRRKIASVFGAPVENVRVLCHYTGGGFGCKGSTWAHVALAAMAAKVVKRPVKVAIKRQQMFGNVGFRPQTIQHVSLGATQDGKLVALRHAGLMHTSQFDVFVEPVAKSARFIYSCPNVKTSHRVVRQSVGTPTYMRAPGESSGSFALESAMDELAYELKIDPIELRLRNYAEMDEDKKLPYSSKSLRECYRIGAERFGWSRRNPQPRSMTQGRMLVGLGMATATYPTNRSPASALTRLMPNGNVLVQSGSQDLGTGTYTVMTQVAAETLGVPVERVRFELGDTQMPDSPGSGGSQTAASVSSAVKQACEAARRQAIRLAIADASSPLYNAAEEDVIAEGGRIYLKNNPSKGETYAALMTRKNLPNIEAKVQSKPGDERQKYSMHAFGAQFAEAHVDPDTGEARVRRFVGTFGVGRVLNAKTARSQMIGGIIYGIGMALTEETVLDERYARVVTPNLAYYHVPVNADVPEIDIVFVDENDPFVNPLGVKGIGEIGITGVAAAIANAVYHATGKRVRDLPLTPDKLL